MNVEIRAEAALFPEKEYISGIFVAVHTTIFWGPAEAYLMHLLKLFCKYGRERGELYVMNSLPQEVLN
jgi:hypothetical protein